MSSEILARLEELPRFSKTRYNLYRTWLLFKQFAPRAGALPVYFIAGSKGKGTVAVTLASVLRQAGLKTGLVTSPHLQSITERISFQGLDIAADVFGKYGEAILSGAPPLAQRFGDWVFGEIILTAALMWFEAMGAEVLVVEAGMGGRLDPGNVFRRPLATCVTNVYLEHKGVLGATVGAIAAEKAAIAKPGAPMVTGACGEALAVLQQRTKRVGAPLYTLGKDVFWTGSGAGKALRLPAGRIPLNVDYASSADEDDAALAACLATFHPQVDAEAIRRGLVAAPRLPGRFEVKGKNPIFVLDVAHTPESLANLLVALAKRYPGRTTAFVTSIMPDKAIATMLRMMLAVTPRVFYVPAGANFSGVSGGIAVASISEGIERVKRCAAVICVTGSFRAVREAQRYLDPR